jgi:putative peptide zinc metalloprotease protein
MDPGQQGGVRDSGQINVVLRKDLIVSVQSYRGGSCYVIEDPVDSRFFRLGIPEGSFIALLNGSTSLRDAIRLTAASLGEDAFTEDDATAIVRWLVDCELAYPSNAVSAEAQRNAKERRKRGQGWNPLAIRITLLHPDRLFDLVVPWVRWLFSPPMWILWVLLCVAASWQLWSNHLQFTRTLAVVIGPGKWISLFLVWVALKVVHECSHAIVCKLYGGTVSEAGIMILWGAPVPYVDATSSWGFGSKWQKIHTAAAGLYSELLIAAIAALLWTQVNPGPLATLCVHVVMIAGVDSLVFNANPLMRFDGYYILMDLLETPNLAASGRQYWQALFRKHLWGMPAAFPGRTHQEQTIFASYGLLAWLWQSVVLVGMVVLLCAVMPIDETWLLGCTAALVVVFAVARFTRGMVSKHPRERPSLLRVIVVGGFLGGLALLALVYLPWPGATVAPAVVDYAPVHIVRAYSPGFVREISVASQGEVKPGQVLAILANDALTSELAETELALEDSLLNLRVYRNLHDNANGKAESERLESLRKRLKEKREQVDRLTVRAPVGGTVLTRNPESLLGKYLRPGNEIVAIGDKRAKELRVSIAQDDVDVFFCRTGQLIDVRVGDGARFFGELTRIEPRASMDLTHPALASSSGGPLLVKPKDRKSQEDGAATSDYELLTPRLTGQITLTAQQSENLGAGQRGVVSVRASTERSIGSYLCAWLTHWCRDRARQLRGALAGV